MKFLSTLTFLFGLLLLALSPGLALGQSVHLPEQDKAPSATQWFVDGGAAGDDGNDCLSAATACKTVGGAIAKAAHDDTIIIAAGVYAENDLQISNRLTVQGAGSDVTILDGSAAGRIMYVSAETTVTDLTFRNGKISTPGGDVYDTNGGAILSASDLTLRRVMVAENSTVGSGGAIYNSGNLTIEDSQVMSNTSEGSGGAISNFNFGSITIRRSVLGGNTATGQMGGAIESYRPVYLTDVTVQDNQSTGFGGGLVTGNVLEMDRVTLQGNRANSGAALYASSGVITITNSTLSGNVATNNYGGIYLAAATTSLVLRNSTIAYNSRTNSAGAGYNGLMASSPVYIANTIFAFNAERNCTGTVGVVVSEGGNLSSDFRCPFNEANDQKGVDPLLGSLALYGGESPSHPLLAGSPAIDQGDNAACLAVDQRQAVRPFDGDGDASAVCDIGAFETRQQLAISHGSVSEGNSGTSSALFTVTLAPPAVQAVSVDYATVPGSAAAGSDYIATTGTLTFDPGQSVKTIAVQIVGDSADESDETFTVQLSNASNADIVDGVATGTIVDDDGLSSLSIDDQTVLEGNSGTRGMTFLVTLSPVSDQAVSVNYSTADGSAESGTDYDAASDTLTFAPGQITKTVTINVRGDLVDEGTTEEFTVTLTNPTGATLADGQGLGTITDDDAARLRQNIGPQIYEGNSGLTPAVFTVTLSTPAAFVVTVDYEVNSGVSDTGATAGEDFIDTDGTLTFQPGETVQTYTVQVIGDTKYEQDEVFRTLIRNGSAPIETNGGIGRILNDDDALIYLPSIVK